MKYMFASIAAAIIVFGVAYLIARLIVRKKDEKHRKLKTVVMTIIIGCVAFILALVVYLGCYYHADKKAMVALQGNDNVTVSKIENGFFFDGPSSDRALIFYPGAKVECEAYAVLMLRLAENGCDCFLADMPLNFALLGENTADNFINKYNYDRWIMAGHSMGGIVAANYAEKHLDKTYGIVLLASYSTTELDDRLKLYSIYGSEDKCLEFDVYNDNRENLPIDTRELVINGGNHAQFGNYGVQKGDGEASVTDEKQKEITVKAILELFDM